MKLSNKKFQQILLIITFAGFILATVLHIDVFINIIRFLWDMSIPFLLGFSLAFILNIIINKLEETFLYKAKKGKRILSVIISFLLIMTVLIVIMSSVGPELIKSLQRLINQIPHSIDFIYHFLQDNRMMFDGAFVDTIDYILSFDISIITETLATYSSQIIEHSMGILSGTFSKLYTFFIAFIFAFYLLFAKETLIRQTKRVLTVLLGKEKTHNIIEVARLSNHVFSNFITCQCLEACILGFMFFVAMTIAHMPYALLVGIVIAVTALIPVFGAFLGCFVGFILIVMTNPIQALWFIALFLLLQQIEGNFIYPQVVGNSIGLPSIWVFVSVIVGNSLMGILGMFIFIPITSVAYTLFKGYINKKAQLQGI